MLFMNNTTGATNGADISRPNAYCGGCDVLSFYVFFNILETCIGVFLYTFCGPWCSLFSVLQLMGFYKLFFCSKILDSLYIKKKTNTHPLFVQNERQLYFYENHLEEFNKQNQQS